MILVFNGLFLDIPLVILWQARLKVNCYFEQTNHETDLYTTLIYAIDRPKWPYTAKGQV